MEFKFENQGTNTYLVYKIGDSDVIDTTSLGMLTHNHIAGLAPTQFTQLDTEKFIKYNVSSHITAKQFFSGPVNKKRLVGVFNGIVDALLSAEEYMIDPRSIIVDLNYMFADVTTCETILICLPILHADAKRIDMRNFFKSIVFGVQFDQTEDCDYVAKIISYLNSAPVFSLYEFKKILKDITNNTNINSGYYAGVQNRQTPVAAVKNPVGAVNRTQGQPINSHMQSRVLPPIAQQPIAQPPIAQRPIAQQPIAQPPIAQPPIAQQPPVQPPMARPPIAQPTMVQSSILKNGVPTNNSRVPVNSMKVPQQSNSKMAIPKQAENKQENNGNVGAPEKEISLMYLLQHYNKENAAAYKAQKEAKKNKNNNAVQNSPVQPYPAPGQSVGYAPAVGNMQPNTSFAVPGQPMPQKQPVSPASMPVGQPHNLNMTALPQTNMQTAYSYPTVRESMSFGETTVLNGGGNGGETTVLNGTQQTKTKIMPFLIRYKNNEKIMLNKPIFRIGKEKSYVDYFIGDNTAVSRSHANIIDRGGRYFVVDTNSTNHTFVNGKIIQSNTETEIKQGDKISFGNEEFEFRLY